MFSPSNLVRLQWFIGIALGQWVVITLLIIERSSLYDQLQSFANSDNGGNLKSSLKSFVENDIEGGHVHDPSYISRMHSIPMEGGKKIYNGVAATLMLNAPQWFQRRYSTMIANVLLNTPNDWAVQVFFADSGQSQHGLNINSGIAKFNATHERLIFTPIPEELLKEKGLRKRLLYMTDKWIWTHMVAERVLVFTGNGVICSNSKLSLLDGSIQTKLFDHFDYIGSPWRSHWGVGGDGSISYRNRTAMIDAINFQPNIENRKDDDYFVRTMGNMNKKLGYEKYRIATKEATHIFAGVKNITDENGPPIVVSGTASHISQEDRDALLSLCYEVKNIFPSLHNPNCFGAKPNGEKCAETICALKDPRERPGGC